MSWSLPAGSPYAAPDASRGYGGAGYVGQPGGHGEAGGYGGGAAHEEAKKGDGTKKMMMGAAAGVAVGAVGGMLLANALGRLMSPFALSLVCFVVGEGTETDG